MKMRWIGRRQGWLLRLAQATWTRGNVGDGRGYSRKVSLGLYPRLIGIRREFGSLFVYLCGVRLHIETSFGGIHV